MSNQISLLSDQNGALVAHISFQGKKIICSPVAGYVLCMDDKIARTDHTRASREFVE